MRPLFLFLVAPLALSQREFAAKGIARGEVLVFELELLQHTHTTKQTHTDELL